MRDQWSSCIHKFREPHMVIMADNKTKMLVDEYMFLPVTYDLHGKTYTVDLRLTILKIAKGNDIIIGLPEIARLFPHLFLDMVERFTEMSRKAQLSNSVPQPLHGLTNSAFLSDSEKMAYILDSEARLDDRRYSAPINTIYTNLGRTRSQTLQQTLQPTTPTIPSQPVIPVATTPIPIPTVFAPALSIPTTPVVYDLTSTTPPLPPYEPVNRIQTSKPSSQMEIQQQIPEVQREREAYYRAKPIGIDLSRYPEDPSQPQPYQRLTAYMRRYQFGVPEGWQDLETPYGHLPLADLRNGNAFTTCAPKLRDARTFAQIDECSSYCRHEAWPYDLVVAVLVPDICRCCIDKMDHYHLDGTSDRHEYFNLTETERDQRHRTFKVNTTSLPFFPDCMKITYANRYGLADTPQQPTSSSSSAPRLPRTPVPAVEKRPRFMRLSQRGIQARIERGEPYEDDLHPDNSDNEAVTEVLNMISSSSVEPEPVAATSLTLQNTPADNQRSPVHQIITQFCRQHRLNAAFQYEASVPSLRREPAETLIERLHNGRYWVLSLAHGTGCVPTCN